MTSVISVFSAQDEDIKVWTEATKKSRAGLLQWTRVTELGKDNDTSLAEEMSATATEIEAFIERLESDQRIKKFRRESFGSDIYDSCKHISARIDEKIQLGVQIMDRVLDLLGLKDKRQKRDTASVDSISLVVDDKSLGSEKSKAKEMIDQLSEKLLHLLARFARILDEEGIPHKYPVPKLPPKAMPSPAYEVREPKEYVASKDKLKKKEVKDVKRTTSTTTSKSSKKTDVTTIRSPVQFLEEYASEAGLNIELIQVRATRTAWYLEYIFTCKLFNINGEGRGKSKEQAKQEAASQVITGLINRQKRGVLAPELPTLTNKEMDYGISLLCEAIDYEEELVEICSKENHRPPIFTVVTKGPTIVVRCNALSASATGKGNTKSIARRMAAKNVIETVMEEKRRAKEALRLSKTGEQLTSPTNS